MISFESNKAIFQLSRDLEAAITKYGFSILNQTDIKEKLGAKGVQLPRAVRIYDVCNPQLAKAAFDLTYSVATMLPCRIAVYDVGGHFEVAALEPTAVVNMLEEPRLAPIAKELEVVLRRIMGVASGAIQH